MRSKRRWLLLSILLGALPLAQGESTSPEYVFPLNSSSETINFIMKDLALPQEPPSSLDLSPFIAEGKEWRGVQCGVKVPTQLVFYRSDEWKTFWEKAVAPYSRRLKKVPSIDFSRFMAVGVFMGEKPFPTYDIEITSVSVQGQGQESIMIVSYQSHQTLIGIYTPHFPVQPFNLKVIPVFEGRVFFHETNPYRP